VCEATGSPSQNLGFLPVILICETGIYVGSTRDLERADWATYAGISQARAAGDACAKKKEFSRQHLVESAGSKREAQTTRCPGL